MLVKNLLLFLISILTISIQGQVFEGEIEFTINHTFKDSALKNNPQLPTKMTYSISGEYSRCIQKTRIGEQSIIKDTLSNKSTLLISIFEEPIALLLTNEKDTINISKVSYSKDRKKILGFDCHKIIIENYNKKTNQSSTSFFYITDKISNSYSNNYPELSGFALEYEIDSPELTSKYSAVKIEEKKIDPAFFNIDKNIRTFTMEEFRSLMNQ